MMIRFMKRSLLGAIQSGSLNAAGMVFIGLTAWLTWGCVSAWTRAIYIGLVVLNGLIWLFYSAMTGAIFEKAKKEKQDAGT